MTADLQFLAQQAITFHQQGNLAEAEKLYRQILESDPRLFGPRYYLGLLRLQQGRNDEAIQFLSEALQISPNDPAALMNHGMALRTAGRAAEALASFDQVLATQPNMHEALYNRGVALADLQRFEDAVESYDRALVVQPEMVAAMVNRAATLTTLNRFDDALAAYDHVLRMQPSNVMALNNRGLALRALRRLPEAVQVYERALTLKPDYTDARYNLAVAMLDQRRAGEALAFFEAVMADRPNDAELLNNRGVALWNLKRPAEALASYDRALAIEPHFLEVLGNRGLALRDMARYDEALACFDHMLLVAPNNAVAWNSRGNVLRDMKQFDQAIASYDRAIDIRPDYAEALNNRGYTHWADRHDYAPALADLERALQIDPEHPYARGEILHLKMYGADWQNFEKQKAQIETGIRLGQRVARPFMFQAASQSPEDLQACSRIWARDMYLEVANAPSHDRAARKAHRKIRLGYVSGEFREQATQILMAGLYEQHDREKFEVIALDNGSSDGSAMRARLEKAFDKWIDIGALSDEDAAAKIRAEEIDILINLNGYFGKPRMGVFARRPAPIQVNYLGFPATLGAPYIDYIIADKVVIREDEQEFYDEQVVTLPASYQANDAKGRPVGKTVSRSEAGLPEDAFVFCNFNNAYKLTPETFAGWMRILKQVDGSVLWLLESRPPFADNLRRAASEHGVNGNRILFAPDRAPADHLARLGLADLFLDSLPYNAHTTASDALWAGVPLLTRRGSAFAGRVATSLLLAAGLPELVTETQQDYEVLAVKLAADATALKPLRDRLAKNRTTCALFDTAKFSRHIEAAYAQMWARWLAGEKAAAFSV
ncbi:MAG TPA: tetratricopeptide repeat protein [Rhizomicrobium sp.]|jgi:predicted O-linked N-acetylglucosamine transferase (SPINDLY family)